MRVFWYCFISLVLIGFAGKSQAASCPLGENEVGLVYEFSGSASHYSMKREDVTCTVSPVMSVHEGDQFSVLSEDGQLKIAFANRTKRVLSGKTTFTVTAKETVEQGFWRKVIVFLQGQLLRSRALRSKPRPNRSDADLRISIPGVLDGRARVAMGSRNFAVSWNGGAYPYSVKLHRCESSAPILQETGIKAYQLVILTRKVDLVIGRYCIRVTDSLDAVALGEFRVVNDQSVPKPNSKILPHWLPDYTKILLNAGWLIKEHGPNWSYEAYLQLSSIFADYQAAEDMMYAITTTEAQ